MARRAQNIQQVVPGLWHVYRYFWPYIRTQRRLIAGSMVALGFTILFRILEPWPLKFVLDRVIPTRTPHGTSFLPGIETLDSMTLLVLASISVVLIATLRALTDYASKVGFFLVGNHVVIRLRNRLYRHLQQLPLAFHRGARSGDLVVRVTRDVNLLRDVTATALLPLCASVLVLVGMIGVMFWLEWRLALLAMATVPLFWLTTIRIGRRIRAAARKQRQREGALAAIAAETIGGIAPIKALGLEEKFAESFAARNGKSQKEDLKANRLSTRLGRLIDVVLALATAMVMAYGAVLVLRAEMQPGSLVVFLVYLKRAFKPAQEFAKYTARLAKATAAGERVIELLEQPPEVSPASGHSEAPPFRGHVCFERVSFGYGPGQTVLNDVNLVVRPGQRVAIVGPSGIGKSTLLSLLLRLYDPNQGQITIDGQDISRFSLPSLRSQISVVLQDNLLFAATVRENIAYGAADVNDDMIEAAARMANAHEFITQLPAGYETMVGERGLTLSLGQRQRVAIARAAVRGAPLLLLDEPTTGLDEQNEREVLASLQRLAAGRTTFLVTHRLALAATADMIIHLDQDGRAEQGTHAELLNNDRQYAQLFRRRNVANTGALTETTHV